MSSSITEESWTDSYSLEVFSGTGTIEIIRTGITRTRVAHRPHPPCPTRAPAMATTTTTKTATTTKPQKAPQRPLHTTMFRRESPASSHLHQVKAAHTVVMVVQDTAVSEVSQNNHGSVMIPLLIQSAASSSSSQYWDPIRERWQS